MKIIVCLKETIDTNLNLEPGLRHRVVFREGLPLVLDPDDAGALSFALGLRSRYDEIPFEIILVSIGPGRVERYLREGLSLGADRAARIPSEHLGQLSPQVKARLLAGVAGLYGADLVLTGARSLDSGSGQTGPLLAARLNFPCIIDVVKVEPEEGKPAFIVERDIGRGVREKLRCPLPAVLAVKGEARLPYASLDKLTYGMAGEVSLLTPADFGATPAQMESDPLKVSGLMQPRPRTRRVATPDSSLPAFYRTLELLKGGISGRKGLMLQGDSEEIADRLFNILLEEGVLKPAEGS